MTVYALDFGNSAIRCGNAEKILISFPSVLWQSETNQGILYRTGPGSPVLSNIRYLVGNEALLANPVSPDMLVNDVRNKINYGLLFSLYAMLQEKKENKTVKMVVSLPDSQIWEKRLKEVFLGTHSVNLDGKLYTIEVEKVLVIEEGLGAVLSAGKQKLIDITKPILAIDGGAGTTIATIVQGGRVITESRTVIPRGVFSLWEQVARSPHHEGLRATLGVTGSPIIVAQSFEKDLYDLKSVVNYGQTDINLMPSYTSVFPKWFVSTIAPVLRETKPYHATIQHVLLTGGFSLLPGLVGSLKQVPNFGNKLVTLTDPRNANLAGAIIVAGKQHD